MHLNDKTILSTYFLFVEILTLNYIGTYINIYYTHG